MRLRPASNLAGDRREQRCCAGGLGEELPDRMIAAGGVFDQLVCRQRPAGRSGGIRLHRELGFEPGGVAIIRTHSAKAAGEAG